MGEQVNITQDGKTFAIDESQLAEALRQGFKVEGTQQQSDRVAQEAYEKTYGGVGGGVAAVGAGIARGATLGASDAVLGALGGGHDLDALREVNPGLSMAGNIAGAALPGILTGGASAGESVAGIGGSLLEATPAAMASRLGARVAGLGEEAGLIGKAAASAGGAALEGGIQNAGAYISDVALGDRDLSAEGFAGAMGQGALWGGVAGGALSLGSGALTAARRLFPGVEMTAGNVAKVERDAVDGISRAVDDGDALERAARDRLSAMRAERRVVDPDFAAQHEAIKAAKLRELEARAETSSARADMAEERAWSTKQKAAEVKDAPRKTRKAMGGDEPSAPTKEAPVASGGVREPTPGASSVAAETTGDTATLLERQLAGTKSGLDAGESLAAIGARRPHAIGLKPAEVEDALNAHMAKVDPEAAKLVAGLNELRDSRTVMGEWLDKYKGGATEKFERSQATRDYAEGMRPKKAGYYEKVPEGEGNILGARGRQFDWRGPDTERMAADDAINAKVNPLEREAIDAHVARKSMAESIVRDAPEATIDEHVGAALKSKSANINDDIAHAAPRISRYEAASAGLAEDLGPHAPMSATERAQGFRDAQRAAEGSTGQAAADTAADIERATATIGLKGPEVARAAPSGIAGHLQDAGAAWQALHMMGIPLPDPHDIPVVGPLLSLYLKARVMGKAFGRFGGKVAQTAEGAIAAKAAATKQRVFTAVDKLLEVGSKGLAKAAPKSGGTAAILGHVLFADRDNGDRKPYTSEPKGDGLMALYEKRADELAASQRPGAIRDSVRDKVRASDPTIVDAIIAAKERKLGYLNQHLPRPDGPPGLLSSSLMVWTPSKSDLNSFARRVEAAEDPAGVLEHAAAGGAVSIEAAETLKTVYPLLFQEAQKRLIQKSVDQKLEIPYSRRLQLSVLFDLPLDASMTPEYGAFLQDAYKPTPTQPQPAPMMGQPTISADVNSAARVDPSQGARP